MTEFQAFSLKYGTDDSFTASLYKKSIDYRKSIKSWQSVISSLKAAIRESISMNNSFGLKKALSYLSLEKSARVELSKARCQHNMLVRKFIDQCRKLEDIETDRRIPDVSFELSHTAAVNMLKKLVDIVKSNQTMYVNIKEMVK